MNTVPTLASGKAAPTAMLKIAGLNLLLPQLDIRGVESVADIDKSEPLAGSAGWIEFLKRRCPVYGLSENLGLITHVPPACRACVLLDVGGEYVGVLSDDVIIMRQIPARQYEVPAAMRLPGMPVQHLLMLDDAIICVSNAQQLIEFIERLKAS